MYISIVIPALNEELTIAKVIKAAKLGLKKSKVPGEIIVADNGSTDRTAQISHKLGARVCAVSEKGYGSAIMGGATAAKGDCIIMGDADCSYDFTNIKKYIDKIAAGYDFVMGNRFAGKIEPGAMPFLHRYLGTPVLTLIMNLLFKTGIHDTNCGMRAFTKKAFTNMHCLTCGMEFATEMVVKASLKRMRIAEVPCDLNRDQRNRKPHLHTWRDGWRHLRFMLLFSPSFLFFLPGLVLFIVGLIAVLFLPIDSLGLDYKHLITAAGVLILGVQIIEYGLAAKLFSYAEHFDHGDKLLQFFKKQFQLERGIGLGVLLLLCGIGLLSALFLSYYTELFIWGISDIIRFKFGIWGITSVLLGVQMIFVSFLFSLFYIKVK